ncbi:SUMF1/EgtB/PvdO family nonheme iron enzyme [Amnibacterium kyonggiense]|uniref:Sulfatase-modifying factor enzyme 1 n=1 Tax=Amnibacterium kyonggiense TaxID=595671 RepID=A0A4R7FLE6_9MICO|nr:SUMF1/EgtB/PvdO family nonheme iron enzyme [Amnibacterium kyonggiense]TDS77231.1 sulfatase-modifying factor enzyme 1 [Amnibacterium kyonggiense]
MAEPIVDVDEAPVPLLDPLRPRPIDLPTVLPPAGVLDPEQGDIAKVFAAPDDPADWPRWRADLAAWRDAARARLHPDDALYRTDRGRRASTAFAVALVWLWDERLFDRAAGRFTPERLLAAMARTGGLDGLVLWHAYPVIGIDDRNQWDFYRDVPGLADLVTAFRDAGLLVFVDYNPWDTGTRRTGRSDAEELRALATEVGADGVFLDTLKQADDALVRAATEADPPLLLEGESRVPNQRVPDHQLSWAQWFADSRAPGVLRAHWYERRHMLHATRRWNRDHAEEVQSAWMNGTGVLVWDTVFGVWVGWNDRDAATLRRVLRVQRAASRILLEGAWTPLDGASDAAIAAGVFASRWEHADGVLWTVVNRGDTDWTGRVLAQPPAGRLVDVTAGREAGAEQTVPAHGVLGLFAPAGEPAWLAPLLAEQAADPGGTDATFPARRSVLAHPPHRTAGQPDPDAVAVAEDEPELVQTWRRRETGIDDEAPYVEEWKPLPPRLHDPQERTVRVRLGKARVARREVSVAEFAAFLSATGYRPAVEQRFLVGSTEPAAPVTGVSLEDARAYAAWCGARLPTEHEWQTAGPGLERRVPAVWNWTESERTDGVTRWCVLKGGSETRITGSDWYVDGGVQAPGFTLKLLLPGLGVDRSPSIGFRIAWDAA